MSEYLVKYTFPLIESLRLPVLTMTVDMSRLGSTAVNEAEHNAFHAEYVEQPDSAMNSDNSGSNTTTATTATTMINGYEHPHSMLMVPVFDKLNDNESPIVGLLFGVLPWDMYLTNLLPHDVSGIHCVLRNTCGQTHTYRLAGSKVSRRRTIYHWKWMNIRTRQEKCLLNPCSLSQSTSGLCLHCNTLGHLFGGRRFPPKHMGSHEEDD